MDVDSSMESSSSCSDVVSSYVCCSAFSFWLLSSFCVMKVKLAIGDVFSGEVFVSLWKMYLKSLLVRLIVVGFLGSIRLI